jgi:hypothetical protein
MSALNLVCRNRDKETVLVLQWELGYLLALHADGSLYEYKVDELKVDLLEAQMRIATNERDNVEMFQAVASDAQ